ncbi:MAG: hypothetical protein RL240_4232 [Planctomycetota bacterium]
MPVEVIPKVEWKPTVDSIDPTKSRLLITVATGDSFRELLKYTGPLMEAYAHRIGADFVAITKPAQDWWGLDKFRVHPFAQAYERTLYVDADVFLTEETPDLFAVVPRGTSQCMTIGVSCQALSGYSRNDAISCSPKKSPWIIASRSSILAW